MTEPTPEDRYQEELLISRRLLRDEMRRALQAIRPDEKRQLVSQWKANYSPVLVNDLLRVAKNPDARYRIANWNLDDFGQERRKTK